MSSKPVREAVEQQQRSGQATTKDVEWQPHTYLPIDVEGEEALLFGSDQPPPSGTATRRETAEEEEEQRGEDDFRSSLPGPSTSAIAGASGYEVKVPGWREVPPVSPSYSPDGTEDLDDEVFERRHRRYELEERQRKRWDMQFQRDQELLERMKQKEESKTKRKTGCPRSFCGDLGDIRVIEVVDEIPPLAFGRAIPHMPITEFSLPWVHGEKETTDSQRTKRKRRPAAESDEQEFRL